MPSTLAWGLVALVAAAVRLLALGAAPLSMAEASSAVIAWDLARGVAAPAAADPAWSHSSPLLMSAQWVLFGVFGGSAEALARFPSALAGAALALVPFLYRRLAGVETALLIATLLALDPTCVEASRRADGAAVAALLGAATLALVWERAAGRAALCLGLLLVAGSSGWSVLPLVVLFGSGRRRVVTGRLAAAATAAAILGASGFLGAWDLLGSVSTALTSWLSAWSRADAVGAGSTPLASMLASLARADPLVVALGGAGLVCLVRARRWPEIAAFGASLAWVALLAARPGGEPAATLLAVLVLAAASVPALRAARQQGGEAGAPMPGRRLAGAVAILALLATGAVLRTARGLTNRGAGGASPAGSADLGLLTRDVERLSSERAGDPHELPVEVVCQPRPDPLLRWSLRDARHVRFRSGSLDPRNAGPALVVGPDPSFRGEAPCEDPPFRTGARYQAGPANVVVLWVPHEP